MASLPVPIGGAHLPSAPLETSIRSAVDYARAEKSAATRRAYDSDWRHFNAWCTGVGAQPIPASTATVAAYLAHMADSGLKASTINRRAAAITYRHRLHNEVPPTGAEAVKAVQRGIRRTIGTAVDRKAPATAKIVRQMIRKIPDSFLGLRDRALLLLGFATALRRSELVALDVEDILRVPEGIWVNIRRSKTDQDGVGREIPVPRGNKLRPVAALDAWLLAAAITSGPIFRPVGKGGRVSADRLAAESVGDVVKRWAAAADLDPTMFGGHSLRAGFVTEALGNNVDPFTVMRITGHKQVDTLKIYDRRAKAFVDHAGRKFL